jgi:hypothetical protein
MLPTIGSIRSRVLNATQRRDWPDNVNTTSINPWCMLHWRVALRISAALDSTLRCSSADLGKVLPEFADVVDLPGG